MKQYHMCIGAFGAICAAFMAPAAALASGLTTIYTFTGGADGAYPYAGLTPGPNGTFFGTTTGGGANSAGTIYQLSPPAKGQTAWTVTPLYAFTGGSDGFFPDSLARDKAGNLYGTTAYGGLFNGTCIISGNDYGCGTVFQLAPPAKGQTGWTLTTLYAFTGGADGSSPFGGVALDSKGVVYAFSSGDYTCPSDSGFCGSAISLTPPAKGKTNWTETTLYSFTGGSGGAAPSDFGVPVLDPSGVIYGAAAAGGNTNNKQCLNTGCGTVFQLTPPAKGKTAWTRKTLFAFNGADGINPIGGLTEDADGNLFGVTNEGGKLTTCAPGSPYPSGCGVTFELSPPAKGGKDWTLTVLRKFTAGADGSYPFAAPIFVGKNIYLTTSGNEQTDYGSLDELLPPAKGKTAWREKTKYDFTTGSPNSDNPLGTPLLRGGVIYGTAYGDGSDPAPYGTIFSYKP
jgi:uncharacterized repeat protein (TIGR03803 family)